MNKTTITYGELKENDIILVQGYEFIVKDITKEVRNGVNCTYFNGIATDNKINKSIIKTAYNGGCYGGNDDIETIKIDY